MARTVRYADLTGNLRGRDRAKYEAEIAALRERVGELEAIVKVAAA